MEVTVFAQTEIYPTENEENVKAAVNNVLDNAAITIKPSVKRQHLNCNRKRARFTH